MNISRQWPDAPRWVNLVYLILELLDTGLTKAQRVLYYRYRLLDRYCRCEWCRKRRGA